MEDMPFAGAMTGGVQQFGHRAFAPVLQKQLIYLSANGGFIGLNYQLPVWHHGHQRAETLTVKADTTNSAQYDFQYGTVVFETAPAGVTVETDNGHVCGETPLKLGELLPGNWNFTLKRNGYQAVPVSLNVEGNQTYHVSTNLISETYLHALNTARQYMAEADYDHALQSANDALVAKPDDTIALALRREAFGLGHLQRAKTLASKQNYIAGGKELVLALQALPDNGEIKELIADYKLHEPAQIERERVERLNSGTNTFNALLVGQSDADLFDGHILKTTMPVLDVSAALLNALKIQPGFQIAITGSPTPETFEIEADQELSTYLGTSAGRRKCFIMGAQTRNDETQILYKVLEYKTEAQIEFSIGNLIGAPAGVNYVPLSPARIPDLSDKLRAQVQAGVSNLTARIQGAIGQTPAIPAPAPQ